MKTKLTIPQIFRIHKKIKIDEENFIILLDSTNDLTIPIDECNSNIYRINYHNEIIWQVSNDRSSIKRDPFVGLEFSNKILGARRFFGAEYEIDISTGLSEQVDWDK